VRRVRAFLVRLSGLFVRARQERDMEEELASHVQMHIEDAVRSGMTPDDARRDALRRLGGLDATKEAVRDRRRLPFFETAWQDLGFAARSLAKNPGFAAVTIATLSLGIGANATLFTVVHAVLIERLPFREPDRLVAVWEENARRPGRKNTIAPFNYLRWQERGTPFSSMAAIYDARVNLAGDGRPEEIVAQFVMPSFFSTLGVGPMLGRAFAPDEGPDGNDQVVVLSHGLWQRRFGADPAVVGKTIRLDRRPVTVVGVMPPRFGLFLKSGTRVGKPADLWMPMAFTEEGAQRSGRYASAIARLAPHESVASAQRKMSTIASALAKQFPERDEGWSIRVVRLHEEVAGEMRPMLLILFGAVGFVLLIACANVASLLLARGTVRVREMAIRTALGAGRKRILSQLLTENVLLAFVGGAVGLLLANWGVPLLASFSPGDLTGLRLVRLSPAVLLFTFGASILTAVLCGLAPALADSRPDVRGSLKDVARSEGTGIRARLRKAFVVAEVALAVVLLVGAGLMLRSLDALGRVNPGFQADGLLTARVTLSGEPYREHPAVLRFFARAVEHASKIPGVQEAGAVSFLPLTGLAATTDFAVVGRPAPEPGKEPTTEVRVCDDGYFRAMRIPLLRGRVFTDREMREKSDVAIISEGLARRYFPGQEPIGRKIVVDMMEDPPATEIIGVVGDVKHEGFAAEARPMVYWPHPELVYGAMTLVLRTSSDPASAAPLLERVVHSIAPDQPLSDVRTMKQWIAGSLARERFGSTLLTLFAVIALLLAAIGIYGVMSYVAGQRRTEIGIRAALGADSRAIRALILRDGARLLLVGLAIGMPLALVLSRVLKSLLFETPAADPLTLAAVVGILAVSALVASYLPARHAARVAPAEALRHS
jgi:putative ABC transport system permease protein